MDISQQLSDAMLEDIQREIDEEVITHFMGMILNTFYKENTKIERREFFQWVLNGFGFLNQYLIESCADKCSLDQSQVYSVFDTQIKDYYLLHGITTSFKWTSFITMKIEEYELWKKGIDQDLLEITHI